MNARNEIWLLRLYRVKLIKLPSIVVSMLYFIIPALVIFAPYIWFHWCTLQDVPQRVYLRLSLAAFWTLAGPLFIIKYDKAYMKFWSELKSIHRSPHKINRLISKYDRQVKVTSRVFWIAFSIAALSIILPDPGYLQIFGMDGYRAFYFYIFLFYVTYICYILGICFALTLVTLKIIYSLIRKDKVTIDIYNLDEVGGFSCFGNLSLKATLLFSTGILFIPIAYDYAINSNLYSQLIVFLGTLLYSAAILVVFLVPVALAFRKADIEKGICEKQSLLSYKRAVELNTGVGEVAILNEFNQFNRVQFIRNISTYPFDVSTMLKIILTALFPVLLYIIQMLFDTDSIFYKWDQIIGFLGGVRS